MFAAIGTQLNLQAAHCGVAYPASLVTVLVGTTSVSTGGQVYNVDRIIAHPDYSESFPIRNDVSVLKLTSNIEFNRRVNVIALAPSAPDEGSRARLTGWGLTSYQTNAAPDILQTIDLNTISNDYCSSRFGLKIPITALCTYNAVNEGACSGDRFDKTLGLLLNIIQFTMVSILQRRPSCV